MHSVGVEPEIAPAPPSAPPSWREGSAVGNYLLLAKLATGGMAEIWLARQQGLRGFERVVVIKRIIESLSADPAFVEMFLDEARIAAQLAHPNVVQIFDLGEFAGAYYLAMEYLAGEHLATLARTAIKAGTPLSHAMAVKIAVAALDGLAHAHTRVGVTGQPLNVVHRDVSPQNIIITFDGQVKLVDFGIARAANRSTQTQGNQVKGKFAYMAPEQARSQNLDGRADIFSIGVILYELVTQHRLWPYKDQIQLLTALLEPTPIAAPHETYPEVPVELSTLIGRALEKAPEKRWRDAATFKAALEDWLRTQGGGPSNSDLAAVMQTLFKARIAQRNQLIEKATRGEFMPGPAAQVMKPATDRSMPGATPAGSPGAEAPRPRASRLSLVVAGLVLAAAAGLGAWKLLARPTETAPLIEEMPIAKTEPPAAVGDPKAAAPRTGTVIIETEPVGAVVSFDGVEKGPSPQTVTDVSVGTHELTATLEGFATVKRSINLTAPGDRAMVALTLIKDQKKKGPDRVEGARGRLSLSTDPWTRVSLGGKVLGDTPLIDVPLPAGRHRLKLVNEEKKVDVTIEVEVKSGQVTKKVLRL